MSAPHRVAVTGFGIVSCMARGVDAAEAALRAARSGLQFVPEMKDLGFGVPVAGLVDSCDPVPVVGKRAARTLSRSAAFAVVAADEAIARSGLPAEAFRSERAGAVIGTGAGGHITASETERTLATTSNPSRIGAVSAGKVINETSVLNISSRLGMRGRCLSISSACCTGADSIGNGFELVRCGVLDVCLTGSSEEFSIGGFSFFATGFGNPARAEELIAAGDPSRACRPFDRDRLGAMIASEGAAILVLERYESAVERGAPIVAEVLGYGSANDGFHLAAPSGDGLRRALGKALATAETLRPGVRIEYVNAHAAGTKLGDPVEAGALRDVLGPHDPFVSSTKPLNGHSQGATGSHEAAFTLLMLERGFVAPTLHLETVDEECGGLRHATQLEEFSLRTALTCNSGLGGSNACVIFGAADA